MPEVVTADMDFEIQPDHIYTPPGGHFWNAFDHSETEVSARYIVRFCKERGGWYSFTREEIEAFYNKSGYQGFEFNRLVHPGPAYSITRGRYQAGGGWVVEKDGQYFVTDDFIRRCYRSAPKDPEPTPASD
jgi:hypothetical protein